MPNYRRVWVPGGTYFFTVNLLERQRSLFLDHVAQLRAAWRAVGLARPFVTDAVVILPDHFHCIWTLPEGDADFATRMAHLKSHFSRAIPMHERRSIHRIQKRERGIFQRRFWEHQIRDQDDLNHHINYIHFNPVKHGYVLNPADWQFSSIHRYVREGKLDTNWATQIESKKSFGE